MDEQNLIFAGRSLESTERRGSFESIDLPFCGAAVWKDVFSMMSYVFASVCVCLFLFVIPLTRMNFDTMIMFSLSLYIYISIQRKSFRTLPINPKTS